MFTGIVADLGILEEIEPATAGRRIRVRTRFDDVLVGESIAVNGVCLTAENAAKSLVFFLSEETLARTNLGMLKAGDRCNLERALRFSDRLSGHLVQGHVDGTGTLSQLKDGHLRIHVPPAIRAFLIEKGSLAIDGISLTINTICDDAIDFMIVPHTMTHTNLNDRRPGDSLNLEVDMVAKYLKRFVVKDSN